MSQDDVFFVGSVSSCSKKEKQYGKRPKSISEDTGNFRKNSIYESIPSILYNISRSNVIYRNKSKIIK